MDWNRAKASDIITSGHGLSPSLRSLQFIKRAGIYDCLETGNFGVIYFATDAKKQKKAIKFYDANDATRFQRYEKLNSFLRVSPTSYFINSEYIENAIQIDGVWHGALIADFIDGTSLGEVVNALVNNKDQKSLNRLSNNLLTMAQVLHDKGIVHKDIHPDNIFISSTQELLLIDYDDIWITNVLEIPPAASGVAGFQHPLRKQKNTAAEHGIDGFSFGVIYIQIQILILMIRDNDKSLQNFDVDGKILFSAKDFVNCENSTNLQKYGVHQSQQIRYWVAVLINDMLSVQTLDQIPTPSVKEYTRLFQKYASDTWAVAPNKKYTPFNPKRIDDARFFLNALWIKKD